MAGCCFQGRPLLERPRNLCVTCLVLDCLFVLIYSLTALSTMSISYKTECYEAHGYTWHNMIALCYVVSAMSAGVGAVVHGHISCNPGVKKEQLINTSRFANALVCWIFTAAVVDAIAYRKEPFQCSDVYYSTSQSSAGKPEDKAHAYAADSSAHQDSSHMVWQLAYPMLWVGWVTSAVAAAMLAKRLLPELGS